MKTFEQVMELTRTISSHTAFEDPECRAYYDLLMSLEPGAVIVEIGLQFGRSSSIVAQVAKEKLFTYIGIDPFLEPVNSGAAWVDLMHKIDCPFILYKMKTAEVPKDSFPQISMALIDGDHWEAGVRIDCEFILPRVVPSGYVCFHDYGRESLPDVYPTVNAAMIQEIMSGKEGKGWEELPTVGCLGIWRKK